MEQKTSKGLKLKHANVLFGALMLLLAAAIVIICKVDGMKFYANKAPGPGFMPMLSAGMIAICGLGIFVNSLRALKENNPKGEQVLATWVEWKYFLIVIGISYACIALTSVLGLVTAVTLAIVMFIKFLGTETWKTSLIVGIGTGIVIYLIFIVFLKVHVPVGPLGF